MMRNAVTMAAYLLFFISNFFSSFFTRPQLMKEPVIVCYLWSQLQK